MANAATAVQGDTGTLESARYDVDEEFKITIPYEVQTGSVRIRGLVEGSVEEVAESVPTGKFKVEITAAQEGTDGKTVITLAEADVTAGDTIRVAYKRRVVDAQRVSVRTNSTTAKGSLYAHWPVYSAGTDCTEAAIKGWIHLYLPRVRVTALPGFENSLTIYRLPAQKCA